MTTDRAATTIWNGDLQSGSGRTSLDTSKAAGPLEVSFPRRAGDADGQTSPEELIAAAHATCFSMALSNVLSEEGHPPERLQTSAVVSFSTDGGPHISNVALTVQAAVPGYDESAFAKAAEAAKQGCPVSKLMSGNVPIELDAQLT